VLAFYDVLSDLLMNRYCTQTDGFLQMAIYVSLTVGPYSWVFDICNIYNHTLTFFSLFSKEGKETETVRELKSHGVFVGLPRKKQ